MKWMFKGCLAVLLATSGLTEVAAAVRPIDRIVAVVNDDIITQSELEARIARVEADLRRQGIQGASTSQMQRQVLDRMITDRLLVLEAKNLGVRVDEATLERALQTIATNNKLTLAQLQSAVEKNQGIRWEKFREDVRTEILQLRLRDREVDSKVNVSDAEVDAFLASSEGAASNREYLVSHILVRAPEGARPEQWDALSRRVAQIQAAIGQGEDFAKLAATYSDAQGATQGGSLGWRRLEGLPEELEDVLPKLKVGQVSGVIRTAAGFHLFKLMDQREGGEVKQFVEKTRARHILLRAPPAGQSDAELRRRLVELRQRLQNGADFAEQARLSSTDGSAVKGGDLGWLSPGETVPDFERAMNALKPGEISEPVQSPFGWHLIQVQERRSFDVTADLRRNQARDALRGRKADEAMEEWLRQLRDKAYVDIRLDQR